MTFNDKSKENVSTANVYMKVHKQGDLIVVAICDEDLLGRTFKQGRLYISVKEEFYGGIKVNVKQAIEEAKKADIVNLVGNNAVQEAIKEGLVHPEAVIYISGIPHAQVVKL